MTTYHNIPLRIARNRTLNLVSDTIRYLPVQDLPVYYDPNPAFGTKIKIYLIGVEEDVEYVLRNERGETIIGNNEIIGTLKDLDIALIDTIRSTCSLFPEEARDHPSLDDSASSVSLFIDTWKRIVELDTPEITGDRAYTILASRPGQQGYFLPASINVRPDKKVLIGVEIQDEDTLIIQKQDTVDIIIAQGDRKQIVFSIILLKSLTGITYTVVKNTIPETTIFNIEGNGQNISLEVKEPMPIEEVTYKVMGMINGRSLAEPLKILNVKIGPKPAIDWSFAVSPAEFPFLAVPAVQIIQPQHDVGYQLFISPIPEPRFTIFEDPTAGDEAIVAASGNPDPAKLIPSFLFNALGALDETNDALFAGSQFQLHEDSVLFVQMKMPPEIGKGQWLTKRLFARVEPDPGIRIRMSVDPPFYSTGADTTIQIRLHNTQKGVGYQLRELGGNAISPVLLTDAALLGRIGWESHGRVFGMRIFSDEAVARASSDYFRIENIENNEAVSSDSSDLITVLPVPADDIACEVEAIKEYTGLTALLTQGISVRKGCLQFNGTTDGIVATDYKGIAAGQARTVEAWIRTSKAGPVPVLVWGAADTPGAKWLLHVNDDEKLEMDIQGAQLTGTTILQDGVWHHVCCVLDPPVASGSATLNHVRLYVDGMPEQTEITGAITTIDTGMELDLTVGNDGADTFFAGDMAEIRVWDIAMPEADIQNNMYQRLAGTETGLALYWKLNEDGPGLEFTDNEGQSRNGTLEGGTWK